MYRFQRNYRLTIFPRYIEGQVSSEAPIIISNPITIEFSVDRDMQQSAMSAMIRLKNLSEDTREQLFKDFYDKSSSRPIVLEAGYDQMFIIFKGEIQYCRSYRDEGSVDFITEIDCFDSGIAMSNSYISQSITNPVSGRVLDKDYVVGVLIGNMKSYSVDRGKVTSFAGEDYKRGTVLMGNTWGLLQQTVDNLAFIDNGKVSVLRGSEGFLGDVDVIDSSSGLLGTPKRAQLYVEIQMMFEPSFQVGQRVKLNSRSSTRFNGYHKIIGVHHQGIVSDSVGGKCRTTLHLQYGEVKII